MSFLIVGRSCRVLKITRGATEKKQCFTADVICFLNFIETFPIHGCVGRQGTFLLCGLKTRSEEQLAALKARLSDLAHAYCGSPIDLSDFLMTKECFQAIKSLRTNEEILITKPDKGAGVVILNKNDYNDKMKTILNDTTKFLDIGPVTNKDNTAKIESRIQRRLLQLRKEYLISKQVYKAIRPTGSQRPRMYGLPTIHKKGRTLTSDFVYDRIGPTSAS